MRNISRALLRGDVITIIVKNDGGGNCSMTALSRINHTIQTRNRGWDAPNSRLGFGTCLLGFQHRENFFLLDGMALVYRAHFALISRPIFSSKGVNTSALYGFTQTVLDILKNQQPTHLAVAFDTEAPRIGIRNSLNTRPRAETMPEDLSEALPHVRRMIEALSHPAADL